MILVVLDDCVTIVEDEVELLYDVCVASMGVALVGVAMSVVVGVVTLCVVNDEVGVVKWVELLVRVLVLLVINATLVVVMS